MEKSDNHEDQGDEQTEWELMDWFNDIVRHDSAAALQRFFKAHPDYKGFMGLGFLIGLTEGELLKIIDNDPNILKVLMQYGWDVNTLLRGHTTYLNIVLNCRPSNHLVENYLFSEMLKILKNKNILAPGNENTICFFIAALKYAEVDDINFLLKRLDLYSLIGEVSTQDYVKIIKTAIYRNDPETLEKILKSLPTVSLTENMQLDLIETAFSVRNPFCLRTYLKIYPARFNLKSFERLCALERPFLLINEYFTLYLTETAFNFDAKTMLKTFLNSHLFRLCYRKDGESLLRLLELFVKVGVDFKDENIVALCMDYADKPASYDNFRLLLRFLLSQNTNLSDIYYFKNNRKVSVFLEYPIIQDTMIEMGLENFLPDPQKFLRWITNEFCEDVNNIEMGTVLLNMLQYSLNALTVNEWVQKKDENGIHLLAMLIYKYYTEIQYQDSIYELIQLMLQKNAMDSMETKFIFGEAYQVIRPDNGVMATPLSVASGKSDIKLSKLLLSYGAEISEIIDIDEFISKIRTVIAQLVDNGYSDSLFDEILHNDDPSQAPLNLNYIFRATYGLPVYESLLNNKDRQGIYKLLDTADAFFEYKFSADTEIQFLLKLLSADFLSVELIMQSILPIIGSDKVDNFVDEILAPYVQQHPEYGFGLAKLLLYQNAADPSVLAKAQQFLNTVCQMPSCDYYEPALRELTGLSIYNNDPLGAISTVLKLGDWENKKHCLQSDKADDSLETDIDNDPFASQFCLDFALSHEDTAKLSNQALAALPSDELYKQTQQKTLGMHLTGFGINTGSFAFIISELKKTKGQLDVLQTEVKQLQEQIDQEETPSKRRRKDYSYSYIS